MCFVPPDTQSPRQFLLLRRDCCFGNDLVAVQAKTGVKLSLIVWDRVITDLVSQFLP